MILTKPKFSEVKRIPDELTGLDVIPGLDDIQLKLTMQKLFDWLKVR